MVTTTSFRVMGGEKDGLACAYLPVTPRLSEFGPIQAIHISLTLPMSHYMYNEWLDKVEIGINCPQPSPTLTFESQVLILWLWFHSIAIVESLA